MTTLKITHATDSCTVIQMPVDHPLGLRRVVEKMKFHLRVFLRQVAEVLG